MTDRITGAERERLLMQASHDYMDGRITLAELDEAERLYGVDYGATAQALARRRHSRIRRMIWRLFR